MQKDVSSADPDLQIVFFFLILCSARRVGFTAHRSMNAFCVSKQHRLHLVLGQLLIIQNVQNSSSKVSTLTYNQCSYNHRIRKTSHAVVILRSTVNGNLCVGMKVLILKDSVPNSQSRQLMPVKWGSGYRCRCRYAEREYFQDI